MKKINKKIAAILLVFLLFLCSEITLPIKAEAKGTGEITNVAIKLSMAPVNAGDISGFNVSLSSSGCYINSYGWFDTHGQPITDKFTGENATLEVVVVASPGYYFSDSVNVAIGGSAAHFDNYSSELHISKSYSPVIWAPNMVKHPKDETVKEGGMASFVSFASFTNKSAWGVLDTEGNFYSIEKIAEKFPDLFFDESYSKLNISPVPAEMNGYKVRCSFTGPGGSVNSNYAEIIINNEADESKEPGAEATPVPTPVHKHSFDTKLSHDAGYHWYGCECGETKDREEHNYKWTQKVAAGVNTSGRVQGRCRVCGYTIDCDTELDPRQVLYMEKAQANKEANQEIDLEVAEDIGFFKKIFTGFSSRSQ